MDQYKKCAKVTEQINVLLSKLSNDAFNHYMDILLNMLTEISNADKRV